MGIGFSLASDFLRRQTCVPDRSLCVVNQKQFSPTCITWITLNLFLFYNRVPLVIEVWHKDSMAGNLLIGVSNMLLASVLSANKVQVLSQVRVKFKLFDRKSVCASSRHDTLAQFSKHSSSVFNEKKKRKKERGGSDLINFFLTLTAIAKFLHLSYLYFVW